MERLPKTDSQILQYLEPLITAGFLSRRRSIVNISIRFWNDTFGKEETLRFHLASNKLCANCTILLSFPCRLGKFERMKP